MSIVLCDKESNRRRIAEDLRKKRIFNAKLRQIGVDIETLKHQVQENCLAKEKELEREWQYGEDARKCGALALYMEHQQRNSMQQQCKQIDEFRLTVQRPENRRDFDLYDPDLKKKERAPRISIEDDCPISGIQKMDGEDLTYKERIRKQKNQAQDFLLQQIQEKRNHGLRQHIKKADWESRLIHQDNLALQLSCDNSADRRELAKMMSDFNIRLALQKQESNSQMKTREDTQNKKEIDFNVYGDMLTENPSVARNPSAPSRILPDRWKGMNNDQLGEYYRGQERQILQNQRKKEQEYQEKKTWEEYIMGQQNTSRYLIQREKVHQQHISKVLQAENQLLAQQQRQQQNYINKVVYSNIPSKDFFDQFNTSSR